MAGSVAAHSWLESVDTEVPNYAAAKADPTIDPYVTTLSLLCIYSSLIFMWNVYLTDMSFFSVFRLAMVFLAIK